MKAMRVIGLLVGVFGFAMATWYGIWTGWNEPVGPVGLYLGGLLGFMLAWALGYLQGVTAKEYGQGGVAPEDDPLGEIDDHAGDYGFFSPHSWWPLFLAASAALCFLGLAAGWWIFIIGVFCAVPALVGWTFEYWKGPHHL